jgi:hypothetical protein
VDVRGDDGYVVAPPSKHENGKPYKWKVSPDGELPAVPTELTALLLNGSDGKQNGKAVTAVIGDKIPKGKRNDSLTSLAGTLRRLGFDQKGILEGLRTLNDTICDSPLPDGELERISKSAAGYPSESQGNGTEPADNPWEHAMDVASFLNQEDEEFKGLAKDILAPGAITLIASPRGLGKTMVAHALAVALAKGGVFRGEKVEPLRVLILDRDNPSSLIKNRLRSWGADGGGKLRILTRKNLPNLKKKKSWESFPVEDYDVAIFDSVGSFTEGVTEGEGKQTTEVLATVLDLARRGLAILLLHNTLKDGTTLRGRGEWADRMDIIYEVRDATGFAPSGKKSWWMGLPEAGEAAWAERAARRKGRLDYRLAFIPSKFRLGQEPEPFCLEIKLPKDEPWTLRDVTGELAKASEDASMEAKKAKEEQLEKAEQALAKEIERRGKQNKPLLKSEAESFLRGQPELSQPEARALIKSKTGIIWKELKLAGGRGKGNPTALLLCGEGANSISATELQSNGVNNKEKHNSGSNTNSVKSPPRSKRQAKSKKSQNNFDTPTYSVAQSVKRKNGNNHRVKTAKLG